MILKRTSNKNLNNVLGIVAVLTMLVSSVSSAIVAPARVNADGGSTLYSKTITVNSGQVNSTLTDFPLLVSISGDTNLMTVANGGHVANTDGSDIFFTDSAGTTIYSYEIESYDGSTGTLVAWVKVPSIADGTVIRIWYGGGSVSGNAEDVWSNSYQAVWHMTEADAVDSTSNDNDGTAKVDST
jgi:hypothetical protein